MNFNSTYQALLDVSSFTDADAYVTFLSVKHGQKETNYPTYEGDGYLAAVQREYAFAIRRHAAAVRAAACAIWAYEWAQNAEGVFLWDN